MVLYEIDEDIKEMTANLINAIYRRFEKYFGYQTKDRGTKKGDSFA